MSIFVTVSPAFEGFLNGAKDELDLAPGRSGVPQNIRFIPRNFLNEERIDPLRTTSYCGHLPLGGPTDFQEWDKAHNDYLEKRIFLSPPAVHDYRSVVKSNPAVCPETFRAPLALATFNHTDFDTEFIRLISVADIAWLSGENEDHIFSLGVKVRGDFREGNPAWKELSLIIDEAYAGPKCQHRPVFAAFYEDFLDELRDPANTIWPNRIRDRLGLYHINQWQLGGLPRRVFLFRYKVRDIPKHAGESDRRPITVPTVIDHRLFEAFCPAPNELDRGRLLNLENNAAEEPAREVLHLFMPLQVRDLFRVGLVTEPVPENLALTRRDHLIWLRLLANRDDYAQYTDADLFSMP